MVTTFAKGGATAAGSVADINGVWRAPGPDGRVGWTPA
jgi:hypothetical protein